MKRQDDEYFGGLREAVLERDGYRCRVCDVEASDFSGLLGCRLWSTKSCSFGSGLGDAGLNPLSQYLMFELCEYCQHPME
jgi:hypothetical protein